jgi:hypothetical protein
MNRIEGVILLTLLIFSIHSSAGPPYDTDDPEPVDYQNWKFYCSSMGSKNAGVWMGTAPHIEINYGIIQNVQLHLLAPLSFYDTQEHFSYGYGMTELGIKYRFIKIDSKDFQIGIFPLIEVPTEKPGENLGNEKAQLFIPLWIQKKINKWSTYGGGGYWVNSGDGNKNYVFIGWQQQYQIVKQISVGSEICYLTASQVGGNDDLRFRIGSVMDFNEHNHLLFSCGRSIVGSTKLQWYLGYQLTI